jgi:hypothetical protein
MLFAVLLVCITLVLLQSNGAAVLLVDLASFPST